MEGRQKELFEALYSVSEQKMPLNYNDYEYFVHCFTELVEEHSQGVEKDNRWDGINDLARSIVPNYREIL